jgi:hypothetical protein
MSEAELPPNHHDYREEARRIRAVAAEVKDARAYTQLLLIAALYEKLAEHVAHGGNGLSENVT